MVLVPSGSDEVRKRSVRSILVRFVYCSFFETVWSCDSLIFLRQAKYPGPDLSHFPVALVGSKRSCRFDCNDRADVVYRDVTVMHLRKLNILPFSLKHWNKLSILNIYLSHFIICLLFYYRPRH